jgi:uracil-DNA glycosylase
LGEREEILEDLRARARFFSDLTTIGVPRLAEPSAVALPAAPGAAVATPAPIVRAPLAIPADLPGDAPLPTGDPAADLEAVRGWIGDCRRCKLAGGRKTIVFGQGHPQARLMFVGEAPGADEDEQGLAFVGKAGQLLTKIIEAIGLTREQVYIANIIKCRPPQNRNPETDEILSCQPFLERQIGIIQPRVLVALGKFAGQFLLKTAEPITRFRGRLGEYRGIQVMPTFHPAYLLRNPGAKKEVWEDMKAVRGMLST